MAKTTTIIAVILVIGIGGGAFFVGFLMSNDWMINTDPTQLTPTIDGIIEKKEWLRSSYYNIPFYLDADNGVDPVVDKANVDGWNYLSVAEDEDYYYLAIDLCSDRTNNKAGEWLALHLANRLPDTFNSKLAFYSLEDFGYEYIYYDVENDIPMPYYLDEVANFIDYPHIPIVPEMDTMEVLRGNITGDFYDFWTEGDTKNFTVTSHYYESLGGFSPGQFFGIQFGVNVTEKLTDEYIPLFWSTISDFDLDITIKANLTADSVHIGDPTEFYCGVMEHGPGPNDMSSSVTFLTDPNVVLLTADTVEHVTVDLDHLTINGTDGMFYFTVYGYNDVDVLPTGFEVQIDKMSLMLHGGEIGTVIDNTIGTGNYDIAYSYGPSENCAEDHRMFEFKIAKSEFPTLDDDMFYINLAGYGTMAIAGSNYWMYPVYGFPLPPVFYDLSDKNQFIALDMSIT